QVPGAAKTILFSHGNAGNLSFRIALIELMVKAGASVFVYDYSGFGRSEGIPTLEGIVEDGLAAYDYLLSKGVSAGSIVIYGESLGAAVSMQVAALREAHGVILQSGFASLRRIAAEVFPVAGLYPSQLFPEQQLDTIAMLRKPHRRLLIIHGVLDEVVPFGHAESMFAEAVSEKYFLRLPRTSHCDISLTAPDEYVAALQEFLLRDGAA
ncbi:MAG TPA: alpha/beta hydrolase, partial [Chroococcales cyanobacterium]